ncbi:MAG TPA: methyl-accepting chemotaxis protein, partial [Nitrospirota bacterium]|nr:methyl-accepting chemotaxis protein [Nitrospirota bacterium]
MVKKFWKDWSIGRKLLFFETAIILAVLGIGTAVITSLTSYYLENKTLDDMADETHRVRDMVEVYDSALTNSAEKLSSVFISYFPEKITLRDSEKVAVGDKETPALKAGGRNLNLSFERVDRFTALTGGVATVFARTGDDFVRVTTSLRKEDGSRAVGTLLGPSHPGYAKLIKGESYTGKATLFGRDYMTKYTPVKDPAGRTIGILFIGLDFTEGLKALEDKIRSIRLGKTGYFYVLDSRKGKSYGSLLVHPYKEGLNLLGSRDSEGREFIKEILDKKRGRITYSWRNEELNEKELKDKVNVFEPYEPWDWVIVAGMYTEDVTRLSSLIMKYLLAVSLVTIAVLVGLIHFSSSRLVSRPLGKAVDFARGVAGGELSMSLDVETGDETGQLAEALNRMVMKLREIVSVVKHSSDRVADASGMVGKKAQEMSGGAEVQAKSAEETSSSMEEMAASFRSVAENAADLARNVEETSGEIRQMASSVDGVSRDSEKLTATVSAAAGTIDGMMDSIIKVAESGDVLASMVSETSSTIQEMAASIKQVDQNLSEAGRLSHRASLDARAGSEDVTRAIDGISRIGEKMDANSRVIGGLGKRSEDIGMIVG